jgi:hypothetical protein
MASTAAVSEWLAVRQVEVTTMSDPADRTTRLTRLARWLGLDHNPLRRRSDKAQTFVMAALLAAFVVGAPVAAVTASQVAQAATLRTQQTQQGWRQVPAVLLVTAPKNGGFMYDSATFAWVRARWTAPDGKVRVGEVPAVGGTRAGSTVRIWIDRAGNMTTAPLTATQLLDRVIAAALFTPVALGIVLLSLAAVARWMFERRRLTHWEAAWEAIEPQWTHGV